MRGGEGVWIWHCFKIKRLQAYSLLPGINENISRIFSQRLPLLPQTTLGVSLLVTNLSNLRVTLGFCSSFSKNPETRRPLGPSKQHRIRKSDAELILMQTNFKNKFKSFGNLPDFGISLRFNGIYYSKRKEGKNKNGWKSRKYQVHPERTEIFSKEKNNNGAWGSENQRGYFMGSLSN